MKKLILSICLMAMLPLAAQKKTFTAACLNVDGLPPSVKAAGVVDVKLNPEGPQETGTLQMSKLVAQKGWDFFGVSENFNYNTQLMSEIGSYYNSGTYRGAIPTSVTNVVPYLSGNKWFETDGLNLLWRSNINVSDEEWYLWNKRNGITTDGADQLIAKGFRYYTVRIGAGLEVDVYILHMDAETTEADNAAREVQMNQLVDMILASDNKRPIIIMGDTNCRYTRDNLKGLMFDRINGDPRFEMHDPWIDFSRKGVMPSIGDPAIMVPGHFDGTNHEAFQTGEVVDKVFYINNTDARGVTLTAKSYLQDTEFTWPDGSEISDHYPIVIEFEIENTGDALSGGQYYLRNVGTGKYINGGGWWDTHAVMSETGKLFTLTPVSTGDSDFILSSSYGYPDRDDMYLDKDESIKHVWTFEKVEGESSWFLTYEDGDTKKALGLDEDSFYVNGKVFDKGNSMQKWELISSDAMMADLHAASESEPKNATFLFKGASLGKDKDSDIWANSFSKKESAVKWEHAGSEGADANTIGRVYNDKVIIGSRTVWSIAKTDGNLPNGLYEVSCQIFSDNNDAELKFNGVSVAVPRENNGGVTTAAVAAGKFAKGEHVVSARIIVSDHQIKTEIGKPGSNSSAGAVFFDNFRLTYYGPTGDDLAALNRVKAAIDDAKAKAEAYGLGSYSNRSVEDAYENRLITGDGTKEVHNTYVALAKAAAKQNAIPADMRYAILNNSFEMGDASEWDVSKVSNARVEATDAPDGQYIFKADGGELSYSLEVTMPAGIYELKAHVSPGAVLRAGDRASVPAEGADGEFTEISLKFILQNGTTTIGVRSERDFMADNFVLTRLGDQQNAASYELVMLAMKDATERVTAMGAPYSDNWDLSEYQAMIDNLSIVGDGNREFNEIYGLLREKVFSQPKTDGVSFTNAIINPSFEFGSTLGWDATFSGDTGVKGNSDATYTMQGCDGAYLFNTWQEGRGTILSQTIPGLPAGHYRLRATVAGDQGSYIFFEVNGQRSETKLIERAKEIGEVKSFEFDVAENTDVVTITISGANSDGSYDDFGGNWYKVDKFELTRHGDTKVCFFYDRLQRAVNRLNHIAADLPDKYRLQWDPSDYRDLYEKHIESNHESDPMEGSNGVAEINELYARFRSLVYSQTESGADMSGAISNQSFELGNLSFWNINMESMADAKVTKGNLEDVYKTEGLDGEYLFNSWLNNKSAPLYQVLPAVPAGRYRLTAQVASDAGNMFYLAANGTSGNMLTTSGSGAFETAMVEFEVEADNTDVLLGLYPSANGDFDPELNPVVMGPWFKADNFRLTLLSRKTEVKWRMESEDYGTIILPFESELPDDLTAYAVVSSAPTDTKGEANYHQILSLVAKDKIEANTPYLVKRVESGTSSTSRSAVRADEDGVYTFTGWTSHTADTYKSGLLTGTLVEKEAQTADHHFHMVGDNIGFFMHDGSIEHSSVEPYHAYISGQEEFIPVFYLTEPTLPVEWSMEGSLYGTMILPFDAEIPEGLEVFLFENLSDIKTATLAGRSEQIEYQLMTLSKKDKISANTPYLVKKADTEAIPGIAETDGIVNSVYTFKGVASNKNDSYVGGMLTGTFINRNASSGDHVLFQDESEALFTLLEDGNGIEVPSYHAYVAGDPSSVRAPFLLFDDPVNEDIETGISDILTDSEAVVDVYSLNGSCVLRSVKLSEAIDSLSPGIYIFRSGGLTLKVMKR